MILILVFIFRFVCFLILFWNTMCKVVCVCPYSHACCIWIVNDITDCNTCVFCFRLLLFFFCFEILCVSVCVCGC